MAARGGRSSAVWMAEPTRFAEPRRFALLSPRCREGAVPGASAQRPPKKAFYLLRMKPLKEPAPNNNNVSFVIHCQLGKEIKHICSNCSRGEDTRDGECLGPSGRRRAREAGRWLRWSPVLGATSSAAWRTARSSALYPGVTSALRALGRVMTGAKPGLHPPKEAFEMRV